MEPVHGISRWKLTPRKSIFLAVLHISPSDYCKSTCGPCTPEILEQDPQFPKINYDEALHHSKLSKNPPKSLKIPKLHKSPCSFTPKPSSHSKKIHKYHNTS
jgi:hypothetical protein